MITIIGRSQTGHLQALATGCSVLGISFARALSPYPTPTSDKVACWGWRTGKILHQLRKQVLVLERGYIGDRFAWTSIAWNGLNGRATFPAAPDDGGERFERNHGHLMRPWRSGGDYVLLCGQVPNDASLGGKDLRPWYAEMARVWRARTGLPVMFRPHPVAVRRGARLPVPGAVTQSGSLAEALERAAVVVTYNSNTSVESVLAGCPTVVYDIGSMAWEMCSHSHKEELVTPDRAAWAAQLAWRQWSLREITSGAALDTLRTRAQQAA